MARHRLRLIGTAVVALLAAGCCLPRHSGPAPRVPGQQPPSVTAVEQEMAVLAFVAYVGEKLTGDDDEVERTLAPCTVRELELQPLVADSWQLTWGPAVFKFHHNKSDELDDNMMYVVRHRLDPERMVVAVRGTNARAILDWLLEDLEVLRTEAWQWTQRADGPGNDLAPRISRGTAKGLRVLREMTPVAGSPGAGLALREFLAAEVERNRLSSLTVVGHSLGGALAPALALWLADTRAQWDAEQSVELAVWGFAGPTPGDADFAEYYDQRLGATTHRIHNPFDAVPLSWQADQLERIPGLYKPALKPPFGTRAVTCLAVDLTAGHHYRQQLENAPPIAGHLFDGADNYLAQVGCQHTCGYYRGLDLVTWDRENRQFVQNIKPISGDCKEFNPTPRCDACPGWQGDD